MGDDRRDPLGEFAQGQRDAFKSRPAEPFGPKRTAQALKV